MVYSKISNILNYYNNLVKFKQIFNFNLYCELNENLNSIQKINDHYDLKDLKNIYLWLHTEQTNKIKNCNFVDSKNSSNLTKFFYNVSNSNNISESNINVLKILKNNHELQCDLTRAQILKSVKTDGISNENLNKMIYLKNYSNVDYIFIVNNFSMYKCTELFNSYLKSL
jgi:hypothetical protein